MLVALVVAAQKNVFTLLDFLIDLRRTPINTTEEWHRRSNNNNNNNGTMIH